MPSKVEARQMQSNSHRVALSRPTGRLYSLSAVCPSRQPDFVQVWYTQYEGVVTAPGSTALYSAVIAHRPSIPLAWVLSRIGPGGLLGMRSPYLLACTGRHIVIIAFGKAWAAAGHRLYGCRQVGWRREERVSQRCFLARPTTCMPHTQSSVFPRRCRFRLHAFMLL